MGFYIRKTLRVGPLRFKVDKSDAGLKLSAGVPGLHVVKDPRGNYIHVGGNGVYYRAALGEKRGRAVVGAAEASSQSQLAEVAMEDVTGATAIDLVAAEEDALVVQLNEAGRRRALWPIGLLATLAGVAALVAAGGVGSYLAAVVLLMGLASTARLAMRDRVRRSVVVFYEVEGGEAEWFGSLVDAWRAMSEASGLWRISASGQLRSPYEQKLNSGSQSVESRVLATAGLKAPKVLVTNISVPNLVADDHALHFLPDRVLVRDGSRFSAVSYGELRTVCEGIEYTETNPVPKDAEFVRMAWQKVNLSGRRRGEPDMRYKDNQQWPVVRYGRMEFTSEAGLRWIIFCSRPEAAKDVAQTVRAGKALSVMSAVDAVGGSTDGALGAQPLSGGR